MDRIISEQAVLDAISRIGLLKSDTKEVQAVAECLRAVEALPPVNPQSSYEETCDIEKSNFSKEQYKLDTDTTYECGYNAGLQAQTDGEYFRKKDVMGCIGQTSLHFELARKLRKLSPVAIPQTDCNTCDKAVRNRTGVIGCAKFDSKPTVAIPSAEPYKGMTNGEVIKMLYPQGEIVKGLYGISGNPLICVNLNISTECSEMVFTEDWWNSPYQKGGKERDYDTEFRNHSEMILNAQEVRDKE